MIEPAELLLSIAEITLALAVLLVLLTKTVQATKEERREVEDVNMTRRPEESGR